MDLLGVIASEYGLTLAAVLYAYTALAAPLAGVGIAFASFTASSVFGLTYSLAVLHKAASHGPVVLFGGRIVFDSFSALLLTAASTTFILAAVGMRDIVSKWESGEAVYAALALMGLGVLALAGASGLALIYAAWILAAITSYVLVALRKDSVSVEAAIKYAATGTVATVVLLLGMALAYHEYYSGLNLARLQASTGNALLTAMSLALIASAAGFKIGIFPFQLWMPDVYGSAEPIAISVVAPIAKLVSLLILVKLLAPLAMLEPHTFFTVLGLLAVITMFYGNVGALATIRDSPQKTLAYSSIAQAGYLAAALAALARLPGVNASAAVAGIAIHGLAYALAKFTAFQALRASGCIGGCDWSVVRGLTKRNPILAFSLAIAASSLAGIPITLGFWGKLYMFLAVASISTLLALLMLANFAIAVFYYGYIIYQVAFAEPFKADVTAKSGGEAGGCTFAAFTAALLTILLGLVGWLFYSVTLYHYP